MQRIVRTILGQDAEGLEVLVYLSRRFSYHTEELWRELLGEGRVLSSGKALGPENVLHSGMEMEYIPRPMPEPQVDWNVGLVADLPDYLVLDKSGNLPCHPAGCFFNNSLWAALLEGRLPGIPKLAEVHFVSRLDRETSGLVLIAKSGAAASRAARIMSRRESRKIYQVLVEGEFPQELQADGWLHADAASCVNKKWSFSHDRPAGIPSVSASTLFTRLRHGNGMSLLQAELGTGRMHQIRATLCSLGYPVVGDKIYGVDETIFLRYVQHSMAEEDWRRLRMKRQALHAWQMHFDGEVFVAPPPTCIELACNPK